MTGQAEPVFPPANEPDFIRRSARGKGGGDGRIVDKTLNHSRYLGSLETIGRHFRSEDRLYAHWCQIMGDAILTVPYEALVSDPGTWIARILDHVGLPPQDGLQAFHKTDRAVTTASFAQVRRPLYTTSAQA